MKLDSMRKALDVSLARLGRPGLSVCSAPGLGPGELLTLGGPRLPHPVVAFSTIGRLRVRGFVIEQTLVRPHHTVWLPEQDIEGWGYWLREFRAAFDPAISREELTGYVVGRNAL